MGEDRRKEHSARPSGSPDWSGMSDVDGRALGSGLVRSSEGASVCGWVVHAIVSVEAETVATGAMEG